MDAMNMDRLEFDHDGFSMTAWNWDEATAQRIATMDGVGHLDEPQLALLRQLRTHYLRWGTPPALSHICRANGQAPDCLYQLFPNPHEAWRIAGLPNPGDEAVAYL